MQNQMPQIDIFPDQFENHHIPQAESRNKNWFRMHRLMVFSVVFLVTLLIGQIIVFIRPPIYLSTATLLTVAPTALDEVSVEADLQHVLIQRQILTGQAILEKTLARLNSKSDSAPFHTSVDQIRSMLDIIPLEETNLVELHAEGEQPEFLQQLINTLLEVYLQVRSDYISETTGTLSTSLQEELNTFEEKIDAKRQELDDFRLTHDILSNEGNDNRARARLRGLNESLNKASEEEVMAKARLDAINTAIAQNKPVVPQNETRSLAQMEQRAQELRERNAELNRLYTPAYINLRPELKIVSEQLEKLEQQIAQKLSHGQHFVITEARLEYQSAKQSVKKIQQQLDDHKQSAADFTAAFSRQEALQEELLEMEELYRVTQQRLLELEVKQREKYPQVDVVEWAFLPYEPIRPLYMRDAGISLAISLILGLIAVWLAEFLTREETPSSAVTLSGIHLYKGDQGPALPAHQVHKQIPEERIKTLAQDFPRQLSTEEINTLLHSAGQEVKQLLLLLLSGITIEEAFDLTADKLELKQKQLHIESGSGRMISLSNALYNNIQENNEFPAWNNSNIENLEDLTALLSFSVIDSGLEDPVTITADALRHSYIVYLVSQGVRLSELQRIVGPLPLSTVAKYGSFSPAGAGISADEISLDYPIKDSHH